MSECSSDTTHFTATDASTTTFAWLLRGTTATPAAITFGADQQGAVGMRTTLCFLPQAASAHGEAFAAGAQCRFQNGTMFGLSGARMALGALLQQTHQFII